MAERARKRLTPVARTPPAHQRYELCGVFQPCLDAQTGALVRVEGLLRWTHPQLGAVTPAQFIPIAEETRLIIPIGAWVIDEACRQLSRWRDDELGELRMSINLSAIQLRDADIVDTLRRSLSAHGVAPQRLELEITETVLMDSAENYLDAIR